jgi:dephospho-CoA kinase
LNRQYVAKIVFGDDTRRARLNGLVHPSVKRDYNRWADEQSAPYLIREAALIFEAGVDKDLDYVIVISAPVELRVQRVLLRDSQRTKEDVMAIVNSQMSEEERLARADFIIPNDETEMILPRVLHLHEEFVKKK